MIGNRRKNGYIELFFNILLSILIFFLQENNTIIQKASVKSAMFDQKRVHSHNHGSHAKIEFIDMKVSGKIEITAITINQTINFDTLKFSANFTAYFVESIAHFIIRNIDTHRTNILVIMCYYYICKYYFFKTNFRMLLGVINQITFFSSLVTGINWYHFLFIRFIISNRGVSFLIVFLCFFTKSLVCV